MGKTSGKESPVFHVFGQMNRRGKLRVCYARDVWRTNGLCIRIRLVVLSNFHVQSFSIRVTDYFILIFKVLKHFLNCFNSKLNVKLLRVHRECTQLFVCEDGSGSQLTAQSAVDWSLLTGQRGPWGPTYH